VARNTSDRGSIGSIDFSPDPEQKYLFVSDILNIVEWIVNRNDGAIAGKIGSMGHSRGLFALISRRHHGLQRISLHP
jgi:hypothetical protein